MNSHGIGCTRYHEVARNNDVLKIYRCDGLLCVYCEKKTKNFTIRHKI